MADVLGDLGRAVFGDPNTEGLQSRVGSYEELHAEAQAILVPPVHPAGLTVQLLQSLNKNFGITHRLAFEPAPPQQGFALPPSMGGAPPPQGKRSYALGAVVTHRFPEGGRLRVSSQMDLQYATKTVLRADAPGDRLQFTAQIADAPGMPRPEVGLSSVVRGPDYVGAVRMTATPELGCSYHQRLSPGSAVTLGGEVWGNLPALKAAVRGEGEEGQRVKPLEWALGAAFDTKEHKTSVHGAFTGGFTLPVFSVHHLYRLNERCVLATKVMIGNKGSSSMAAAGYKLKFRNTLTAVTGMVDTYGSVRALLEREPVKDVRIGLSAEVNLKPGSQKSNSIGLKVSWGAPAPLPRPLSPITMTRDIFAAS